MRSGIRSLDFCLNPCYATHMNNSVIREFYPNLLQKGYTCSEIRQGSSKTSEVKEVPDWAKSRYDTYDEYLDGLHDFMNGM